MLSIYDFKDAMVHLFQEEGCSQPQPLSNLAGRRVAVDCRFLIHYMLNSSSCLSVHESVKSLSASLAANEMSYTVIFAGIDVLDAENFQGPAKALSNYLEHQYFLKLMKKNFSENSLITPNSISTLGLYSAVVKDSLAASIFQRSFEDQLVAAFREFGIDFLKSPQNRECQLGYLYRTRKADWIMATPLAFLLSDCDTIIGDINFAEEHFSVFNLRLFAKKFGLELPEMRKCLFACFTYFKCHDSIRHRSKLEEAANQTQLPFGTALESATRRNAATIAGLIRSIAGAVKSPTIDLAFCRFLQAQLSLPLPEILSHANLLFNSPILANDNRIVNVDNPNFPFSGENLIDVSLASLTFWFCKQYFDHNFFALFNKCTKYTYYVSFPKIEILELRFMHKTYLKEKLEECMGYVLRTIPMEAQADFRLNLFGEESIKLAAKKKQGNFYCLPSSKAKPGSFGRLYGSVVSMAEALYKGQALVPFRFDTECKVEDVVSMVNLNFMADLGYIDLERKALKVLGVAFLHLGDSVYDEELIIAFECVRCLLLHKKDYKFFPEESDRLRTEIFKHLHSHRRKRDTPDSPIIGDPPGQAPNGGSSEGSSSSGSDKPPMMALLINNSLFDISQIQVETLIGTPYNVIKNFELDYINFYDCKDVRPRLEEILKTAFKEGGFQRILFIGRILFFVPSPGCVTEIFDADFNQFKQLFLTVRKSLNCLIKASFRMFAYRYAREHDAEFIESVLDKLPFQKQKTSHLSSLIKIMMQKYLIYKTLKHSKDPFAPVFKQRLDPKRIRAKINNDFDLMKYLDSAVIFYKKLWGFAERVKGGDERADVNGIAGLLADSWKTFDGFVRFCREASNE